MRDNVIKDSSLIMGGKMLRPVLQNEASECGLACIAMICAFNGKLISLVELRRKFLVSTKGVNLQSLMDIADRLQLASRPVRLDLDDMDQLKLPAILHWGMNHFVVLAEVRRKKVVIFDPALGRRVLSLNEVSDFFTGVAVEFTAVSGFDREPTVVHVKFTDLFSQAKGLIPSLFQMFVLAVIMQAFSLAAPILNQIIVDEAVTKGDLGLLNIIAFGMFFLLITTALIKVLQSFVGLYLSNQLWYQLQTNLLRHALRLPISWFERRHIGDIVSRFGSLSAVKDFLMNAITASILSTLIVICSFAMMMVYSSTLAVIELSSVIIFGGVRALSFPYIRRKTDEGIHLGARVQTTFLETLRSARTFKLFGKEQERIAVWQNEQAAVINNQVDIAKFSIIGGASSGLLLGTQQIIVWLIGARMVINGNLTLGMLIAFQAYTAQFGGAAAGMINTIFSLKALRIHLERLSDIIHSDEEGGLDVTRFNGVPIEGGVSLKNVSFRYADHDGWVIKDVNLEIKSGEFVCLQGPSGQGKTSIIKLILGFYDPTEGEVFVDDLPLRVYGTREYRQQIGVVLQDDILFSGTIADNISFFDYGALDGDVEAAGKAAHIHDEIMRLPMGYMTLCGDLGSTLSGGQRQRVLLARALYRKPKILILDEGTANLDPDSEKKVMESISTLDITRIVVAHRDGATLGVGRFIQVSGGKTIEL